MDLGAIIAFLELEIDNDKSGFLTKKVTKAFLVLFFSASTKSEFRLLKNARKSSR